MQRIIFFDGMCLLCNGFINYVFNNDKNRYFKYASLQSKSAAKMLSPVDLSLDTVIYIEDNQTYKQSTAVLRIMFHLGGIWSILSVIFAVIPTPIRDFFYKLVARSRYSIFGKSDICRLPSTEEKAYFLD
ncbi:DCC1-like thiol-disulfide oxidoreductase family protein [bacterium]|nr:DCC1-like thiol-disulfide oxidoreductase family protein [bacterium]